MKIHKKAVLCVALVPLIMAALLAVLLLLPEYSVLILCGIAVLSIMGLLYISFASTLEDFK